MEKLVQKLRTVYKLPVRAELGSLSPSTLTSFASHRKWFPAKAQIKTWGVDVMKSWLCSCLTHSAKELQPCVIPVPCCRKRNERLSCELLNALCEHVKVALGKYSLQILGGRGKLSASHESNPVVLTHNCLCCVQQSFCWVQGKYWKKSSMLFQVPLKKFFQFQIKISFQFQRTL